MKGAEVFEGMKKYLIVFGSAFVLGLGLLITVLTSGAYVSSQPEFRTTPDSCSVYIRGEVITTGIYSLDEALVQIHVMDGDKLLREYEHWEKGSGTFSFTENMLFSAWGGRPDKVEMKIISLKLNNVLPLVLSIVLLAFSIGGAVVLAVKYKKERKKQDNDEITDRP